MGIFTTVTIATLAVTVKLGDGTSDHRWTSVEAAEYMLCLQAPACWATDLRQVCQRLVAHAAVVARMQVPRQTPHLHGRKATAVSAGEPLIRIDDTEPSLNQQLMERRHAWCCN